MDYLLKKKRKKKFFLIINPRVNSSIDILISILYKLYFQFGLISKGHKKKKYIKRFVFAWLLVYHVIVKFVNKTHDDYTLRLQVYIYGSRKLIGRYV